MKPYQREFLQFAIASGALRFGEFKLKSGRHSPYFFNAGLFNTGAALKRFGEYYAAAILDWGEDFDVIFGPAYKGIPLAASVAMALSERGKDVGYCFNRKEIKDHGEGGSTVGAPLKGRVLIVDDVISAGLSAGEAVKLIRRAKADPVAMFIALDRQERSADASMPASLAVAKRLKVEVNAIVKLDDLIVLLEEDEQYQQHLASIQKYREQYGS
jgi:orotate phosphoribosyltransferase